MVPFDTPIDSCTSQATSLAARLRVAHQVDGEQRRLGLHVMHVGRVVDAGVAHGRAHAVGDLLDHRRPADVLRQKLGAHRRADGEPRFVGRPGLGVAANMVACGVITPSQPPDQTIGIFAISASLRLPCLLQHRRNAWSARMRVKSLTPPLPSVLPMTAITSSALN